MNCVVLPAEQGKAAGDMAAAAREPEGKNGTLGLRGGPRCAFIGLRCTGWPPGSIATAAEACEREEEDDVERETGWSRWQVGPEGKRSHLPLHQVIWAVRGKREEHLGRGEEEKGPKSGG